MKRILTLLLVAVMVIGIFAGCGDKEDTKKNDAPEGFSVGYAKVDITPSPDRKLPLVGGNDEKTRVATGVLERLWATCTAMTDAEGNTVILFAMDNHHVIQDFLAAVRSAIHEKTGLPEQCVQMTASHTHQGPPLTAGGYGYPDGLPYMMEVVDKCAQAAADALADRKSATMSIGHTRVPNLNKVRYYYLEDGTLLGTAKNNTHAPYYGQAYHPDDLLQLVQFKREGGRDVVLINWQGHYRGNPEGMYTLYSSDYMGVLRNQLLDQAGCESLVIMGCGGNSNHNSSYPELNNARNASYKTVGTILANEALLTLNDGMRPAKTDKIVLEEIVYNIKTNPDDYNLACFSIGEVGFCMMPYEPFISLGQAVRDESPFVMTFICTLANGSANHFYLPDAAAYVSEGATPGSKGYGISKKYVQGDSDLFHEQYLKLLKSCFDKGGVEQKEKAEGYMTDHEPYADPTEYMNAGIAPVLVKNGLYQMQTIKGGNVKVLLIDGKEIADELAKMTTFKVLLDNRDIVVGIQK